MLSGCVTLGETYRADLPSAPGDLRTTVPQPDIAEGQSPVKAIANHRFALKQANSKITRWDKFYERVKKGYGSTGKVAKVKKRRFKR